MVDAKAIRQKLVNLSNANYQRLCAIRPNGALEARLGKDKQITFLWRGSLEKKTVRIPIGFYDSKAPPKSLTSTFRGYSIQAAIRKAEEIASVHAEHKHQGGYQAVAKTERLQQKEAYEYQLDKRQQTLEKLLLTYCDYLESKNRSSHKDARSIFRLHVFAAFPKYAQLSAADITPELVADMMRNLSESGKHRTADKLRSYVSAAYELAKTARLDSVVPVKFKAFKVTTNPASETRPTNKGRVDKNPLPGDELKIYWQAIKKDTTEQGAILQLHLLTGGQRPEQFVKLLTEDINEEQKTIAIYDSKGRPGSEPRTHLLPIIPAAEGLFPKISPCGYYALSTQYGSTHIAATTLLRWAQELVKEQLPEFKLKQVRSGVETALASLGVSSEIRGRLQSHGISGVQDRHYDGYDYLKEKRKALITLHQFLEE